MTADGCRGRRESSFFALLLETGKRSARWPLGLSMFDCGRCRKFSAGVPNEINKLYSVYHSYMEYPRACCDTTPHQSERNAHAHTIRAQSRGYQRVNQGGKSIPLDTPWQRTPIDRVCPRPPRPHVSGQEQVILYTLLLRMRYGYDASANGLLVYTAADSLHTGEPETAEDMQKYQSTLS